MAEAKRKAPARKTTAKKTTKKAEAPKAEASVQTTTGTQTGPVRVEAGGIDPRLVEQRERQKAEEAGVAPAAAPQPASIDPKLLEARERTIQRERELAGRSLLKPPARP